MTDMTDNTVSQAAALLGVSSRQVHRYIDRGALPSHWVNGPRGREKRIAASAVADLHGQRDALDEPALPDTSVKRDMADKRDMTDVSGQRDLQDLVHPSRGARSHRPGCNPSHRAPGGRTGPS